MDFLTENLAAEVAPMTADELLAGVAASLEKFEPTDHGELLGNLLEQVSPVDFRTLAELTEKNEKLAKRHYYIIAVEQILALARLNHWDLCRRFAGIFLFNGAFWKELDRETITTFLGEASEKLGVYPFLAKDHEFRNDLWKQFLALAKLPAPSQKRANVTLVNLQNGTFEIGPDRQFLRQPDPADFLKYQLPFAYDPKAKAPTFQAFLDKVQPDPARQKVLAEYLGYVFIKNSTLKLEKVLLLHGSGSNGKSVFFEIVQALFGEQNVTSFSLKSLTQEDGYTRASLANSLVNYASEINGKLESSIFKALASGEPVEARKIYGEPFTMTDYARLIFNCNLLPREIEMTHAFFRRWLLIGFDVTISEAEQDKTLAQRIIKNELSGVFNWVLEGLRRLLEQKNFTQSDSIEQALADFKKQSDNVRMFLDDENFEPSNGKWMPLKEFYAHFRGYCSESGGVACHLRTFGDRLRGLKFQTKKMNIGQVVFVQKRLVE